MARYLVVANQTLGADALAEKVRECMAAGGTTFHVVVPACHSRDSSWITEGHDHAEAERRLEAALARFRELGAEADGEVGDASPVLAINDALLAENYDAVILSTLPAGLSRWLKKDLPHRIESKLGIKVIHVEGRLEPAS
jgi:nucleotide-binding universal stress UspA family protein